MKNWKEKYDLREILQFFSAVVLFALICALLAYYMIIDTMGDFKGIYSPDVPSALEIQAYLVLFALGSSIIAIVLYCGVAKELDEES